jgi:hypothetical protein
MAEVVASLAKKSCELEARLNNWHALLEKARNRIGSMEATIMALNAKRPKAAVAVSTCGGEEMDATEFLAGCDEGQGSLLKIKDCQEVIYRDKKFRGQDIGPLWLEPRRTLMTNLWTANQSFDVSDDLDGQCRRMAIVGFYAYVTKSGTGGGATDGIIRAKFPDGSKPIVVRSFNGSVSHALTVVPIWDDDTIRIDASKTGTTDTAAALVHLYGFL